MTFHDRLLAETRVERADFLALAVIRRALAGDVSPSLYRAFLVQAWHHVRTTVPLLALALSRCGPADAAYADALLTYLDEERGHDRWILEDLAALGLPPGTALPEPNWACRAMVGYVQSAIEHESPYAMLGMAHVLEGVSAALAGAAARAIAAAMGRTPEAPGFRYLTSHGDLDRAHVAFFRRLVDGIEAPAARDAIITTARVVYRLYGAMFIELPDMAEAPSHAA